MLSPIEEVKSRLDIVEVLSGYIKLHKAGSNFKALCPFHSEKSPSFMVSPSRQIWHCFGCGEGGDIFKFIMKIEGVEFGDALRNLAQRAGVVLKREDPQIRTERAKLLDICKAATEYFRENLKHLKEVREYLKNRGLKEETIDEFKIGFAVDSWDGALKYLISKNFSAEDIEKAGLVVKSEKSDRGYFDRFRSRIMFPIFDSSGEIIGFGGRMWEGNPPAGGEKGSPRWSNGEAGKEKRGEAKYINSPQTMIYDKSRVLYGFDKAKMDIRKNNFTILVEGYMDLIMSHQAGVKNAVAVSGTSMTRDHLRILKRLSDNLYTCFDMDNAGDIATKRAIDLALAEEFNVKVVTVPSGKDPADFILEHSNKWEEQVKKAKNFMEFYFENIFSKHNADTVEGKKDISKILLPQIKKIRNKIEQSYWISTLSQKIKIKPQALEEEMAKIKIDEFLPAGNEDQMKEPRKQKPKDELLCERTVACILKNPKLKDKVCDLEIETVLCYPSGQLLGVIQKTENDILEEIKTNFAHLSDYASQLLFSIEAIEELESLEEEIKFCVKELKANLLKEKLNKISFQIQEAEEFQNEKSLSGLMQEFKNISNQLQQVLNS